MPINSFGQEIGMPLPHYTSGERLSLETIQGHTVRLEKLSLHHADDLYQFYGPNAKKADWTYLPLEPFEDRATFQDYFQTLLNSTDPYYFAIIDQATNHAVGTFALLRIDTNHRSIEVGWVIFSPQLQRTRQATEAHYLLMTYVFEELGYRRYEWKCDSLNQASQAAANRLGFIYEGTFRQALVYKERNRDTAWFSLLDHEWPDRKHALENWLKDSNFDDQGQQKQPLSSF
ncbi:GNAT family protein [Streptococcus suis]|uniref:GNAT family N-acetyltransferase n=1 Tax=Streptococcus suis TaxID=1307 RepID=UPI00240D2B90|nr:GNAT family protein [Streptococcus suis]WFA76225.1 GNAT family protein [Streptococcus suis]